MVHWSPELGLALVGPCNAISILTNKVVKSIKKAIPKYNFRHFCEVESISFVSRFTSCSAVRARQPITPTHHRINHCNINLPTLLHILDSNLINFLNFLHQNEQTTPPLPSSNPRPALRQTSRLHTPVPNFLRTPALHRVLVTLVPRPRYSSPSKLQETEGTGTVRCHTRVGCRRDIHFYLP